MHTFLFFLHCGWSAWLAVGHAQYRLFKKILNSCFSCRIHGPSTMLKADELWVGQLPVKSMEAVCADTARKWSMLKFFIHKRKPQLVSARVQEESLLHCMLWAVFAAES
ncbi:hypothetical protein GDO78_001794 [Eleutherodactylus coqui]|uniref:Secreted protein n=1 Tax=Eleutherodactylus coqui TaxID=57060 RepID=A0A8J6FW88_ELECQ|nr:hypothetical protein GDO78_001794 [Eleutherodactylus coqui]